MAAPPVSRRRIIYYAHLPEVVRNPASADQRYRSYDRYDPYYDNYNYYNYNPMMSSYRVPMPNHAASSARPLKSNETMRSSKTDKRFDANDKFIADKVPTRTHSYRGDYYWIGLWWDSFHIYFSFISISICIFFFLQFTRI